MSMLARAEQRIPRLAERAEWPREIAPELSYLRTAIVNVFFHPHGRNPRSTWPRRRAR